MKKFLMTCAMVALVALPAGAAPQECAYSPRQTLVRDAKNAEQIAGLIRQGVIFDETPRCGGTIMQLAVRRGNPEVLRVLLEQDLKRANQIVPLDDFPIPGAPKKIPLWLFAAYYAPNEQIIHLLHQSLIQTRGGVSVTDDMGRNVLWYMDRNPVLRKTSLYDQLNDQLLTNLSADKSADALLSAVLGSGNAAAPATGLTQQPSQLTNMQPGSLSADTSPKREIVEPPAPTN